MNYNFLDNYINNDYSVIVIDPPWNQGKTGKRKVRPNQGISLDYSTMSKIELMDMPISKIGTVDSFLFLWTTNSKDKITKEPFLQTSFDLLDKWGYTFYTMITWNKNTGPCPFGPFQIVTEYILFAYGGKCTFKKDKLGFMKNIFTESSKKHSVKPQSFYNAIVEITSGKRIDIFARQIRKGFDGCGNEYNTL
jgi:N6-adenosine-specific RNA methylase IME4